MLAPDYSRRRESLLWRGEKVVSRVSRQRVNGANTTTLTCQGESKLRKIFYYFFFLAKKFEKDY